MKILIVGPAWPYRGGIADFDERIAREYIKKGDEVEIFTFTLQYPSFLFPGKTQYSPDPRPEDLDIKRKVNSINPFNWIKVGRELKKKNADLLIIKFWLPLMAPCFGTIARIVKGNGKTKVVSILDNIIPHEHRPGDKILSKYFVSSIDAFIAMSKSVYDDLKSLNDKKPCLMSPHPIYDNFGTAVSREEAIGSLGLDPSAKYMLFFGFIRDYKGLDILLKAIADERIKNSDIKLIVAGEFYNNSETYFELEKQLGLEGKIIWRTDFIADEQVKNYFCASDIIVQPYKTATQSGVTQIAYHFEKPMLVTNVGGLPEIVPNGKVGYSVEPEAKVIADAINDFYSNGRYAEFVENIKEEKKKYSWDRMLENVDKAMSQVK
ncbi:MAG: glycosyltransferase family 4 protein [Paludibacteraceae bacterium]|nr:glycosyltransferase family 4 protein [Paludibacteraceae bacterium]MBR2177775.1 glycosyltransferase family 4 protein [Paludibacteraceae bacterium]